MLLETVPEAHITTQALPSFSLLSASENENMRLKPDGAARVN